MEKRTDEIGKVSQNQLVVAKKLTFIKEGEGGKGRGMRGKVREADNVADFSQIFNKLNNLFSSISFSI